MIAAGGQQSTDVMWPAGLGFARWLCYHFVERAIIHLVNFNRYVLALVRCDCRRQRQKSNCSVALACLSKWQSMDILDTSGIGIRASSS